VAVSVAAQNLPVRPNYGGQVTFYHFINLYDEEINCSCKLFPQVTVHSEEEKQLIKQMRKEEKKLTKVSSDAQNIRCNFTLCT
jgi:hypothetical protein